MSLACLDSPALGTLKREIIEKEDISLTGIACYTLSQLKLQSIGSRAHVKAAHSAVLLANILPTDYFLIYAFVHYKRLC